MMWMYNHGDVCPLVKSKGNTSWEWNDWVGVFNDAELILLDDGEYVGALVNQKKTSSLWRRSWAGG